MQMQGGDTKVTYNQVVYTAAGGYGGYNSAHEVAVAAQYPRKDGMHMGGRGMWWGTSKTNIEDNIKKYYHTSIDNPVYNSKRTEMWYTIKGEDGARNPFDESDTNLYGSGGGGGYCAYLGVDLTATYPNYGGKGAGRGGYGANNATTNRGGNATFYGGGGGGAAFSSNHSNSLGGSGYQGIVKIYFYKYV